MTNETNTLRTAMTNVSTQKVSAVIRQMQEAFAARDAFEAEQGLDLNADNSYTRERDRMLRNDDTVKNADRVARMFAVLDVKPADLIMREHNTGSKFNAKALKKVTELARFSFDGKSKIESVLRVFCALAIVHTERNGARPISNTENQAFLNSKTKWSDIFDETTCEAIEALSESGLNNRRAMTTGCATQSSQVRNVLEALGAGDVVTINRARDGIKIDATSPLIAQLASDFSI